MPRSTAFLPPVTGIPLRRHRAQTQAHRFRVGWLPGVLRVEGFPEDDTTFYEFYVPINETQHRCFHDDGAGLSGYRRRAAVPFPLHDTLEPYAIKNFLMQDVMARESTAAFL